MLDSIAYYLVRGLNLAFNLIPVSALLWVGRRIGDAIFFFNRKRRLIAYANLKFAFAREKEPAELKSILKGVYRRMVETFVEVLNLTKVSPSYVEKYVEVINYERIVNGAKSDKGVILLTAHFGDWELSSLVGAIKGFPMTVLVREQKMKRLNELLNRLRESKGCKVVRKGISVKSILRSLHNREIVGILADQDAGKTGVFVDFFGRPTSTAPGAFEFASRTGAILLPNFIVRTHGPYHRLFLDEYIDTSSGTEAAVQHYMHLLESYVRRYPEQWLWLHKRWKSTPVRSVLVLDDGKAGHLNQSLAVAHEIRKARQTQGVGPEDTKITIIGVKYRGAFARALLTLCSNFSSWRCHGCMRCMKLCLEEGSYRALMGASCDFVVSCGSSLAPVNVFMAKENNAKNIVVMKPQNVGIGKFTLAVIPEHDRPPMRKNVVSTVLAPTLIDGERLKADGEALKRGLGLTRDVRIGVLLGGDTAHYTMTEEIVNEVIDALADAAGRLNAEILVTTSRRTPAAVERILRERIGNDPRCRLLVIANESNPKEAVGGILHMSQVVVVSAESISMISEAVSAGKGVVAFFLKKKGRRGRTKHDVALGVLESRGYLKAVPPRSLADAIEEAVSGRSGGKGGIGEDKEKVYQAVRRLI